ncbi:hypothetical protein H2200_005215 [Cladophialophora chaetospira]|uniref:Developmental regulatory protein wetA n=1 Tax=Cladophialophora chaetospira TaxID=386627 RepID=A0AA39CJP3_9EURO|nr:hypothetical protein H2200_005215 [Cladophialophora chaetospira]
MSIADSPDYPFRSDDKNLKMFYPTATDEGNSFDDFFNEEMYRPDGSDEENKAQFDDFEDLFNDAFNQDDYKLPTLDTSAIKAEKSPPQPWREGVWCLKQRQQPPKLTVEKTRRLDTKRPQPIQTMNVINHHFHHAQGPQSPLEITSPSRTKRVVTSPATAAFDPTTYVRPPFARETTLSPSPMYAQLPITPRPGHADTSNWQQDFQNFHLRQPYERQFQAQSSPRKQNKQAQFARDMNAAIMAQNRGVNNAGPSYFDTSSSYSETSAIDPVLLSPQHDIAHENQPAYSQEPVLLSPRHEMLQENHHAFSQDSQGQLTAHALTSMQSPIAASLPSSTSSAHSQVARTHTSNTSLSMQSSQPIFSPPITATAHPPLPTLAPEEAYPVLAAPTPQRVPHPILHQPNDISLTGLGIQYLELEQMSQAVLYEPQSYLPQGMGPIGVALPYPPATTASNPMYAYPPLPPPPSHIFSDLSPFNTPRKQRRSPSRSPSPPISPSTISPRRNPRRSPNRCVTDYAQSRRKSIHKPGPIKDLGMAEPPTPRTRSSSRPPRTPRGPKTPTGGGGMVDFVNFTPKDASKLLNDVAPSGSSKTRARREQEAREKRKKLSEAAKRAVVVAGGDVAAFERAIFT